MVHKTIRIDSHITNYSDIKYASQYHVFTFYIDHNQPYINPYKSFQQHLNISFAQPLCNAMKHRLYSCMRYRLKIWFFIRIGSPLWAPSPHSELQAHTLSLRQVTSPLSKLVTCLFHNKNNVWCITYNNAITTTQ